MGESQIRKINGKILSRDQLYIDVKATSAAKIWKIQDVNIEDDVTKRDYYS